MVVENDPYTLAEGSLALPPGCAVWCVVCWIKRH